MENEPLSSVVEPERGGVRAILATVGFSDAWIERLASVSKVAFEDRDVWLAWQDELSKRIEGKSADDAPTRDFDWQVLALAIRMNELAHTHATLGIDATISARTIADLARWADAIDRQTVLGRNLPLTWFRNHLERNLLEIGCLQFVPGPFGEPFRVFRRTDASRDLVALAWNDIPCDSEGWPTGREPSFVTVFSEDSNGGFLGHPLRPETGAISPDRVSLPAAKWEQVLGDGDTVLQVHIPEGSTLSEEACREAFERAEVLYRETFPKVSWQAFYCTTWMLDPALDQLLDPSSRIRAFSRQFRRATMRHPNGRQIVERVLGNAAAGSAFVPKTSLQKKVCDYLGEGGVFRTTGGYRLPNKLRRDFIK